MHPTFWDENVKIWDSGQSILYYIIYDVQGRVKVLYIE
jgi:hypothetical protein